MKILPKTIDQISKTNVIPNLFRDLGGKKMLKYPKSTSYYIAARVQHDKVSLSFKLGFNLCILIFALLLTVPVASAQESQRTITIVPPTAQHTFNPGDKAEGVMKVINDSSQPLTFQVEVRDYIVTDTKGTPNLLPLNSLNKKYSAAAWLGATPSTFTVQPHQRQTLNYYLQVPLDASPGGHYAAVVYTPANAGTVQGSGTSVETQIGTLFYVTVNGDAKEQSNITRFLANVFQEYGPVTISTQIQNLGDLHIRPNGVINISDMLGRKIETQKLTESNIFPTASRDYENKIGQTMMIGRFKADLIGSYGKNNNLPLLATVYFWVFPWKIAVVVILTIVALILGIMFLKKKRGGKTQNPEIKEEQPRVAA